jgi:hypothetical protein
MCCLIVVAHHRYLPALACSRHLDSLWPPVSPLTVSCPRSRCGGIGSAGAPVKTDLAILDAKHWVEMRMRSQVFVSQHASAPMRRRGWYLRTRAASALVPAQPCHDPWPDGTATTRRVAGSIARSQYLISRGATASTQQGAQHGRVHAPVRRGGSWQPDAVAGVLRPRSAGAMPTE